MSETNHVDSFKCPACGGTIEYKNTGERTVKCGFCGTPARVPEFLLTPSAPISSAATGISGVDLALIVMAVQKNNKLEAIKVYRRATNASLDVAKLAVAQIELDVTTGRIKL